MITEGQTKKTCSGALILLPLSGLAWICLSQTCTRRQLPHRDGAQVINYLNENGQNLHSLLFWKNGLVA